MISVFDISNMGMLYLVYFYVVSALMVLEIIESIASVRHLAGRGGLTTGLLGISS